MLRLLVDFAGNAKANGHLDEFEVLLEEIDFVVRLHELGLPEYIRFPPSPVSAASTRRRG